MEAALLRLEAEGQILRGRFTASAASHGSEIEWCNRRVLARIHRLTLGPAAPRDRAGERPRLHAVPVSLAALEAGHAASRTRRRASHHQAAAGIRNLRGGVGRRCAAPANRKVRARAARSAVPFGRGRLGPVVAASGVRRSGARKERDSARRVRPTRSAPVALFLREDARGCSRRAASRVARVGATARRSIAAAGIVRRRSPGARVAEPSRRVVSRRRRQGHAPADERRRRRACGSLLPRAS